MNALKRFQIYEQKLTFKIVKDFNNANLGPTKNMNTRIMR